MHINAAPTHPWFSHFLNKLTTCHQPDRTFHNSRASIPAYRQILTLYKSWSTEFQGSKIVKCSVGELLTHDGEDYDPGKHWGAAVGKSHDEGVARAVVVDRVVGGVGDQASEGQTEREEDLGASLQPDQRVGQTIPLGERERKKEREIISREGIKANKRRTWQFQGANAIAYLFEKKQHDSLFGGSPWLNISRYLSL